MLQDTSQCTFQLDYIPLSFVLGSMHVKPLTTSLARLNSGSSGLSRDVAVHLFIDCISRNTEHPGLQNQLFDCPEPFSRLPNPLFPSAWHVALFSPAKPLASQLAETSQGRLAEVIASHA